MNINTGKVLGFSIAVIMTLLMVPLMGCHHEPQQTVVTPPPPPPPPPREQPLPEPEEWVDMPVRIVYRLGGSRLDDVSRALLRELHATASHRTDIVRISVEGHADSRGSAEANERLGAERAHGVVDFLVGELGMPRELFETHSFGDSRPITSCTTEADCLQNRRVEFRLLVRRRAAP